MITIQAHVDGKVIVPDEPVDVPKGEELVVRVEIARRPTKRVGAGKSAGGKGKRRPKRPSIHKWARTHAVADDPLPADLGHQHDHYLFGTPRKPPADG
jgi:hypothetical protein